MGLGDNIVVNNFMFCRDHGNEYCVLCFCDHRMCNNIQIEDDVVDLSDAFTLDDRQPINVFEFGTIHRRGDKYECRSHSTADCKTCFNWVEVVRAEAKEAEKTEQWLHKREKWLNKVDP